MAVWYSHPESKTDGDGVHGNPLYCCDSYSCMKKFGLGELAQQIEDNLMAFWSDEEE